MPALGPVQLAVGLLFVGLTLGVVAVLLAVARHAHGPALPYAEVSKPGYALRRVWLWVVLATATAAVVMSLFALPYPTAAWTSHAVPVRVVGQQYAWQLSTTRFHVGETVDFAVTSLDVNHGYGLYDPTGELMAQVQAMPGYVNHLIVTFRLPGTYIVRCLEYCGQGHQVMEFTFTVTRSRS